MYKDVPFLVNLRSTPLRYACLNRHLNAKTDDVIYYSDSDWIVLYDVPVNLVKSLLLKVIYLFVF